MLKVDQTRVTFIFLEQYVLGKGNKRSFVCSYIPILPEMDQSTDVMSLSLAKFFHIWKLDYHRCFQFISCQSIAVKIELSE